MHNVINGALNNLQGMRSYYFVFLAFIVLFEIIGLILKRDIDEKMVIIKAGYLSYICIIPFLIKTTHVSYVFDLLLVLMVIINICNVCINREQKIKLLKEKN